ncbi:HOS1 Histone deacetylase HOS1 [Candida maltosa Xu316]
MDKYVQHTAASSILTARSIIKQYTERDSNEQIVGINWYGGRHHCHKSQAAGYCYINDVILAINVLRKQLGSVFYLDLDLHHGDGVENGFKFSRKIATCSIHRYDIGFYPGTGSLEKSTGNTYNIPTKKGLTNSSMEYIIREIVIPLITKFDPKCIVIQAGCDGLTADEHKEWNMSIKGYANAIDILLNEFSEIPVMILGGGGYNHTEVAKCWTYITGNILESTELNSWDIIPEHNLLDSYEKDGFRFWTDDNSEPGKMQDENTEDYLEEIKSYLLCL